jgi:hypothetical protein
MVDFAERFPDRPTPELREGAPEGLPIGGQQLPDFSRQEWRTLLGDNLMNLVEDWIAGEELPSAARTRLEDIAQTLAIPSPEVLRELIARVQSETGPEGRAGGGSPAPRPTKRRMVAKQPGQPVVPPIYPEGTTADQMLTWIRRDFRGLQPRALSLLRRIVSAEGARAESTGGAAHYDAQRDVISVSDYRNPVQIIHELGHAIWYHAGIDAAEWRDAMRGLATAYDPRGDYGMYVRVAQEAADADLPEWYAAFFGLAGGNVMAMPPALRRFYELPKQ